MAAKTKIDWDGVAADRLGYLRADKARIDKEIKEIEDELKSSGKKHISGSVFYVTISRYTKKVIDWRKICSRIGVSAYMKRTYCKKSNVVSLKCTAHVKDKK